VCREQAFLLPPDVREWLLEDHLAWFVIGAVGVMDRSRFYAAYREDGHGRAALATSDVAIGPLAKPADARLARMARRGHVP
jgi:hypothetical protein